MSTNVVGSQKGPGGVVYAGAEYKRSPVVFGGSATFQKGITSSPGVAVTTPAVPATTVAVTNSTGVNCFAYVTSGGAAVSAIDVNGVATGQNLSTATSSSATVYLPAGATISLTYASTAPTWVWQAM